MHIRIVLIVLIISFFSQILSATHIVGGELRYDHLGSDAYKITLTFYRDCYYGDPIAWFDNPASIGIFDGNTDTLVTSLGDDGEIFIPLMGNDTLNPQLNDPCLVAPPRVCVHTTTYTDIVNLPYRTGGYTLAYQRCCRNQTIQNIIDPLNSGATYLVRLTEKALRLGNSSPQFNDWPPIYICTNRPIDFDHSATDPDGDSLVYKLCTPIRGLDSLPPRPQPPYNPPYDRVKWIDPPFNLENLIGGEEPLRINSSTGFMTGIPDLPGQFVVGVCVEEYRDGELIGILRRDFQYNIGLCALTSADFTPVDTNCTGNSFQMINESVASSGYKWIFGDLTQPKKVSQQFEPMIQYGLEGQHKISLIAFNETGCRDTLVKTVTVNHNLGRPWAEYQDIYHISVSQEDRLRAINFSSVITSWEWFPKEGLECTDCHSPVVNDNIHDVYTVVMTDTNGCKDTARVRVKYDLYVPNVFTPNNDGINDYFTVFASERVVEINEVEIFNRWGDRVYHNFGSPKWDGEFNGSRAQEGVYILQMTYSTQSDKKIIYTRDITLIR